MMFKSEFCAFLLMNKPLTDMEDMGLLRSQLRPSLDPAKKRIGGREGGRRRRRRRVYDMKDGRQGGAGESERGEEEEREFHY